MFNGTKQYKMRFKFIKKCFFRGMNFFSLNVLNVNYLEYVSMNNQECKIGSEIVNVNTNEPMFFPYSITINKCKGSCTTTNDPYTKLCVRDTIKTINIKVFNVMSRWNKQRWNEYKCICECKELIDKGMCDQGFI